MLFFAPSTPPMLWPSSCSTTHFAGAAAAASMRRHCNRSEKTGQHTITCADLYLSAKPDAHLPCALLVDESRQMLLSSC